MRLAVLIIAASVTACSYKPVVDLRANEQSAHLYQRDLYECKQIIKDNRSFLNKPLLNGDPMLDSCLKGRGHSVLNQL